ncbi:sigma factor G inhibitor Gin [Ferviditalea candida]|uniref:Sigma factor G inhibitor Gin n=1 Tax=Ferviditalea candida TaxID=3108399 RepID=A0ABU5ZIU0_9BACL|nr:sigma factor G inhibitor Gin [Paenibacillaceae bacterium T2]
MDEQRDSTCIICKQEKSDGIKIYFRFICSDCEKEMVQTDVQDTKYLFFIDRMRQIWDQKNA